MFTAPILHGLTELKEQTDPTQKQDTFEESPREYK